MTWLDIFRKAKANDVFSDRELDLIEGAARSEIDTLFDRGKGEAVAPSDEATNGKSGRTRKEAENPTLMQSSKRANVLALRDWMTMIDAAQYTGYAVKAIKTARDHGLLDVKHFDGAPDLVNVQQIAHAIEHFAKLPVDLTVFDGWKRQSDLAADLGMFATELSKMVKAGSLAAYKPHPRLVLLNEHDVLHAVSEG